jgi:hypothetical protein
MNPLSRRLAALEIQAKPAGRVRTFFHPRAGEMNEAQRAAWLAEQAPDLDPRDQVVVFCWITDEVERSPLAAVAA